ncbi:hypothetical protein Tco_0951291 [Tanacetum coccineum]|uniref:Uncharacterized protein n=1 Tax=Tanacetum coccineum TaxID=301880 RepID=A0ABQ5DTP7_9ASTR
MSCADPRCRVAGLAGCSSSRFAALAAGVPGVGRGAAVCCALGAFGTSPSCVSPRRSCPAAPNAVARMVLLSVSVSFLLSPSASCWVGRGSDASALTVVPRRGISLPFPRGRCPLACRARVCASLRAARHLSCIVWVAIPLPDRGRACWLLDASLLQGALLSASFSVFLASLARAQPAVGPSATSCAASCARLDSLISCWPRFACSGGEEMGGPLGCALGVVFASVSVPPILYLLAGRRSWPGLRALGRDVGSRYCGACAYWRLRAGVPRFLRQAVVLWFVRGHCRVPRRPLVRLRLLCWLLSGSSVPTLSLLPPAFRGSEPVWWSGAGVPARFALPLPCLRPSRGDGGNLGPMLLARSRSPCARCAAPGVSCSVRARAAALPPASVFPVWSGLRLFLVSRGPSSLILGCLGCAAYSRAFSRLLGRPPGPGALSRSAGRRACWSLSTACCARRCVGSRGAAGGGDAPARRRCSAWLSRPRGRWRGRFLGVWALRSWAFRCLRPSPRLCGCVLVTRLLACVPLLFTVLVLRLLLSGLLPPPRPPPRQLLSFWCAARLPFAGCVLSYSPTLAPRLPFLWCARAACEGAFPSGAGAAGLSLWLGASLGRLSRARCRSCGGRSGVFAAGRGSVVGVFCPCSRLWPAVLDGGAAGPRGYVSGRFPASRFVLGPPVRVPVACDAFCVVAFRFCFARFSPLFRSRVRRGGVAARLAMLSAPLCGLSRSGGASPASSWAASALARASLLLRVVVRFVPWCPLLRDRALPCSVPAAFPSSSSPPRVPAAHALRCACSRLCAPLLPCWWSGSVVWTRLYRLALLCWLAVCCSAVPGRTTARWTSSSSAFYKAEKIG